MAKRKISKWVWILGGVILVLLIIAYFKGSSRTEGVGVKIETVSEKTIVETVSASGKIFPEKEVKISSDVSGEIVELTVEEGDTVKVGDVLARIDPELYESRLDQGQASISTARAQLQQARSNVKNSEAQLSQTEAQLTNQRAIHNRNKELFDEGVISEADFENSLAQLRSAESSFESAKANLESAKEGVKSAQYSIQSASASADEIRTSLNRTTITAPTDGIVSLLNVEEGERVVGTIQMTGTEMMRIADLSIMEAQVEVSENDILRVNVGNPVEIEVDAYYGKTFDGVVTEIANSASNITSLGTSLTSDQVTNFIVKVRLNRESYNHMIVEGKPFPFRPGMSTSVEIETKRLENVHAVPIAAVTTRDKKMNDGSEEEVQEVVFQIVNDTVAMTPVKVGIQDNKFIQLIEGPELGTKVVSGPFSVVSRELESGDKVYEKESEKSN